MVLRIPSLSFPPGFAVGTVSPIESVFRQPEVAADIPTTDAVLAWSWPWEDTPDADGTDDKHGAPGAYTPAQDFKGAILVIGFVLATLFLMKRKRIVRI